MTLPMYIYAFLNFKEEISLLEATFELRDIEYLAENMPAELYQGYSKLLCK